ncbi:MAG: hypothetical protein ACTHK3_08470, partial [Solirubrobacterales bacterium]
GSGPGQITEPIGIAAPTAQKLLIVDSGNDRVGNWSVKGEPPLALKRPATDITSTTALLHASINPEALATTYYFEYGPTTAYGTKVPITPESIGSGSSIVQVSQTATGLSKGTTYHYRAIAESAAGLVEGADSTFVLKAPKATTEAATAIKTTQATLNGKVDPEGSTTTYWFEYGETASYGTKTPLIPESVGAGTGNVVVSQTPTGLKGGTTYHFRLVAESEGGTSLGKDATFTTEP